MRGRYPRQLCVAGKHLAGKLHLAGVGDGDQAGFPTALGNVAIVPSYIYLQLVCHLIPAHSAAWLACSVGLADAPVWGLNSVT